MEILFLTLGMHVMHVTLIMHVTHITLIMHITHTHSLIFWIFVTLTKLQIQHLYFFTIPYTWTVASQQKKTKLLLFISPHM